MHIYIYTPQKKLRILFFWGYFLLFEICHYNLIKNTPKKNILNFFWGVYIYIYIYIYGITILLTDLIFTFWYIDLLNSVTYCAGVWLYWEEAAASLEAERFRDAASSMLQI